MNFSDFVFSATEIASFDFNQQTKRIWEATNNKPDSPQNWQFRYDPLFIPEISNNQLLVKSEQWQGHSWRTSLTILLDNEEARKLAYQSICKRYPEQAQKIQLSSIFALPTPYIKVNIPDLKEVELESKIIRDHFEFGQPSQEFTIKIASPDRDTALKIEKKLSSMTLEYEFSVSARKAQQNTVKFSLQKLKDSKLYKKLHGLGDVAYVHRDDLRKLLEKIHTEVSFDAVIEKPDHFESGIFDKLLTYWNQSESSKNFDETKWQSTYNQDDLKPNIITKELNKIFTKNEDEKHWKFNPSADINADAGALTQIKTKMVGKLSLSNDDLKKLLREQNIEADIQGTKIEAKSIDLCQVNLAAFNEQTELISVVTFVEPIEANTSKGSVEFSRLFSVSVAEVKDKIIALFGKTSVGKSAILNSLIGADIATTSEQNDLLIICFKSPFVWLDLPGIIGNKNYEELAIKKAQQADGQIFVIDGEPYKDEMESFDIVHAHSPDIPKIVFVNKWDIIQNHTPKKEQEIIRCLISEKMGKFVKNAEDIVYGNAMNLNQKNDEMVRQNLPQLINKIKEVF
ncbi:GTPase domain-containing protein [Phormidium sp. LEGE 05292]|uniref:GTPase domain-containing protein n=1 Tax=[Phormidium] sp. LEGE 05292 TaxID=767427 RepID=UPI0018812260|nr:GTPase domain-containing protein [Phormidium sp. LEGE 05292]MBE9224870.1 GTPase domain-containing protein [Phormidium sp. LEGE 05292]